MTPSFADENERNVGRGETRKESGQRQPYSNFHLTSERKGVDIHDQRHGKQTR